MQVKIDGNDLMRDTRSMGISNVNVREREEYLSRSRMMNTQKEEISALNDKINSIKNEVSELKDILLKFIEKTE